MKKLIKSSMFSNQLGTVFERQINNLDVVVKHAKIEKMHIIFEIHVALGRTHNPVCSVFLELKEDKNERENL